MDFDPQKPSAELLEWAYRRGAFPMVQEADGEIVWLRPDPRAVFPLDAFHVPRRLRRTCRSGRFELRVDTAFQAVMRECAAPAPGRESTWIDARLEDAYGELHRRGKAHSIEAFRDDRLVGGIYGVRLGAAFFGESMFSRPALGGRDASKVALVALVELLRALDYQVLDTQFWNPHLEQFGCIQIPDEEYAQRLGRALTAHRPWPPPGTLLATERTVGKVDRLPPVEHEGGTG